MNWSTYYQDLSIALKRRFIIRAIRFYRTVSFVSDKNFAISKQMKIIVSSAFIQITFGLRKHKLSDFTTIHLMPRAYSYFRSKQYYSGDVNPQLHRMTLSWAAVEKGYEIHDDALNVCIHEFGHCLLIEHKRSFMYYYFNLKDWENYKVEAKKKFQKIRSKENTFLRSYGGSNLMELFSVALEAFFEQSESFKQEEAGLYNSLCKLLRQDPTKKNWPLIGPKSYKSLK